MDIRKLIEETKTRMENKRRYGIYATYTLYNDVEETIENILKENGLYREIMNHLKGFGVSTDYNKKSILNIEYTGYKIISLRIVLSRTTEHIVGYRNKVTVYTLKDIELESCVDSIVVNRDDSDFNINIEKESEPINQDMDLKDILYIVKKAVAKADEEYDINLEEAKDERDRRLAEVEAEKVEHTNRVIALLKDKGITLDEYRMIKSYMVDTYKVEEELE